MSRKRDPLEPLRETAGQWRDAVSRPTLPGWAVDLLLVALLVLLADVALLVPGVPWPIEWLLGVPLLLFLPGYALLSALFPESPGTDHRVGVFDGEVPGWPARLALAVVVSFVLVAVVGVLLAVISVLTVATALGAISVISLAGVAVAAGRRESLSPTTRAAPLAGGVASLRGTVSAQLPGSTIQTAATAVALLVLVASLAYAGAASPQPNPYTEFYLGNEEADGDLVAEGFPTTVTAGERVPVTVVVENEEDRRVSYNVVVLAQRVADNGTVTAREHLDTFSERVRPGERAVRNETLTPTLTGDSVRIRFLLYKGPAADQPSVENADLSLRLWVTVADGET